MSLAGLIDDERAYQTRVETIVESLSNKEVPLQLLAEAKEKLQSAQSKVEAGSDEGLSAPTLQTVLTDMIEAVAASTYAHQFDPAEAEFPLNQDAIVDDLLERLEGTLSDCYRCQQEHQGHDVQETLKTDLTELEKLLPREYVDLAIWRHAELRYMRAVTRQRQSLAYPSMAKDVVTALYSFALLTRQSEKKDGEDHLFTSGIWSSHHLLSLLYAAELALMLLTQDATTWTETAEQVSDQFASQYHCQDFFWPLSVFPEPENRRLATFSQLRTFALGCLATFLACIEATPQLRQTWNTEQAVSMQAKLEELQDTA